MVQLAEERQQQILEAIQANNGIVISQIAGELAVSEMTIRRDLQHMEDRGLVIRVHGGAIPAGVRFDQRLSSNAAGKSRAARKLAPHVPASGTIYLDGSTTMLNLIGKMKHCANLQVVTNNAETFKRLAALPGVEALLIGGRLDKRTDNLVGTLAARSIRSLTFDAAFFSAWGLDPKIGPTEVTLEDAEVKDLVAERSRQVYLSVDSTKLNQTAAGNWHLEKKKSSLATNLSPDHSKLAPFAGLVKKVI